MLAVILQRAREGVARLVRRFEHHERLGLDQPVVVRPADHGGFQHVGMALQHALDLERRHIHAGDLEHVVAAAAVDEIAVVVLDIFVARAGPVAEKGRARLLAVVPIHHCAGRPAYLQLTHLAAPGDDLAIVVDQAKVVAGDRPAAGAVFHVARTIAEVDVQHFGRADAVENVDAITLAPASADVRRQRLAGRDAAADFELVALGRRRTGEEAGIERRHRVEHGDLVFLQKIGDQIRRRPMRQQHGGRADRHRKRQRIAEAVGEEQLCHRIADVLFGDAEYRRGIEIVGEFEIGVGVHGAFRFAGGARRIEPEAHIVARRRRGDGIGFGGFEQFVEALVPPP